MKYLFVFIMRVIKEKFIDNLAICLSNANYQLLTRILLYDNV